MTDASQGLKKLHKPEDVLLMYETMTQSP